MLLKLFEALTGLGAILALFFLAAAMAAPYAPAQNAAIAMAIALVAIPYCVAGVLHRREVLRRMPKPERPTGSKIDASRLEPLDF